MAPLASYTSLLTAEQANELQSLLHDLGFEFSPKQYTLFFAQKNKLSVAVYEKGPKVLVQGKGVEEFVQFELEPKILGEAKLAMKKCTRRKCSDLILAWTKAARAIFSGRS
jgi:ribonuclease HIII